MIITAFKEAKSESGHSDKKILITTFFFLLAGLCEIGGGIWYGYG
jgi:hypothetical protein